MGAKKMGIPFLARIEEVPLEDRRTFGLGDRAELMGVRVLGFLQKTDSQFRLGDIIVYEKHRRSGRSADGTTLIGCVRPKGPINEKDSRKQKKEYFRRV